MYNTWNLIQLFNALMKIFIHDYAGHPFQVDLSKKLAQKGYEVFHAYFAGDSGPKGNMNDNTISNLKFLSIGSSNYSKTNFIKRRFDDLKYGRDVVDFIEELKPDVVLSGNTPTETQNILLGYCKKNEIKFIYWIQDFYSIAASLILKKKIPFLGSLIGSYYKYIDKKNLKDSDSIIVITDLFIDQLKKWRIDEKKINVIPNWGSLDDILIDEKYNSWSKENINNINKFNVIYSGTMALKHNPEIIIEAAKTLQNIEFNIIGFGVGVDYIKENTSNLKNIHTFPIQPFNVFSKVLASADILIAVIENDAGKFSVPSKILNYMCAGKPIVLSAPIDNLASKIINNSNSGITVGPKDYKGFSDAINKLANDKELVSKYSKNSRDYAEKNFNIELITQEFEKIFKDLN